MKSTTTAQRSVDNSFADQHRTVEHADSMTTFETRYRAQTSTVPDFVDVTPDIADAVARSEVRRGRAVVFAPDDSCTIIVNERETGLLDDLRRAIVRLGRDGSDSPPPVGSSSVVVPIDDGTLQLGTWQRVLLVELAAPGARSVDVQIVGDR